MGIGFKFKDGETAVAAMKACDSAGARWETVRNWGCGINRLDVEHLDRETPEMAREIISTIHAYGGEEE